MTDTPPTCTSCNGTGNVGMLQCVYCGGTGTHPMTDSQIPPALTDAAWASIQRGDHLPYAYGSSILDELPYLEGKDLPAAIAFLNNRLPEGDPRKITRERIFLLRHTIALAVGNMGGDESPDYLAIVRFADALASLLPPE